MHRIYLGSVPALLLASITACGSGGPTDPPKPTAPVLHVTGPAVTLADFDALATAFDLPAKAYAQPGYVEHTDFEAFLAVPTTPVDLPGTEDEEGTSVEGRAFDFDAIKELRVLDADEAIARAEAASRLLDIGMLLTETATVEHATLQAWDGKSDPIVDVPIDTQVAYEYAVDGVPVIGPGAKFRVVFNADGTASQVSRTVRPVARGADVPIRPLSEAAAEAVQRYYQPLLDQGASNLQVEARLVYYAPPPELDHVETIYPHYAVDGSFLPAGGGERISLRTLLLPAVQDDSQPKATLTASLVGDEVVGNVAIEGGTPPFTIDWTSSTKVLLGGSPGQSSISYPLGTSPLPNAIELVGVTVQDANGLRTTTGASVGPVPQTVEPPPPTDEGLLEHGAEWVGTSQGLPGSGRSASRFVYGLSTVSTSRFNFGDYQTAERRFKDIAQGGADYPSGVDSVDIAFYAGHANGDGWTFPTSFDAGMLTYPRARYGNGDLEWLVIAACGPLQPMSGPEDEEKSLVERWGPAFQGLHLLCGYANVSRDNALEGQRLAERLIAGWTVRQAWIQTAIDIQGRAQVAAVMGVLGPGGISNWNDHLHGRGSVGPDITDVRGYWVVYMNCR